LARVALVYGNVFLKHDIPGHVERSERASVTYEYLRSTPLYKRLVEIAPRRASAEEITLVHTKEYYRAIVALPSRECVRLDADTAFGPGSLAAALSAAGAVTLAVDKVAEKAIDSAFCLVRPPGHHARPARAMGFCIFNNIAIGAAYATRMRGFKRAAVIDFDVHHGNGTQEMFYDDPAVLYSSVHRWPFYPGSGLPNERGEGRGAGKTVNVPLPAMSGEEEYLEALEEKILPAVREHKPSILFISAGFDAHEADLLGGMGLTTESYGKLTRAIARLAGEVCDGRIISALEGGYNLEALATSVHAHVEAML
jgi:acetoin utilization deacetylase AcuC-like enzyme